MDIDRVMRKYSSRKRIKKFETQNISVPAHKILRPDVCKLSKKFCEGENCKKNDKFDEAFDIVRD